MANKPFNLQDALAGKPVVNGRGVATAFTTEYLADVTKHNGNGSYGARRLGGKAFKIVYED